MKRVVPMALAALTACVGPERLHCDTSGYCHSDSALPEGDTDTDTDADTDSDPPEPFDPYAFFVEYTTGFDGVDMVPYGLDQNDPELLQDPFIVFTIAERPYFDTYNASYTCRWTGKMDAVGRVSMPEAWTAWQVQLTLISTTCDGFPERDWGESTPTTMLEQLDFKVGYGPMSDGMTVQLRQAVEEAGEDWYRDWEPYVFSGFVDFGSGTEEGNFTFAQRLEEDFTPIYDENNEPVYVEMNRATELEPFTQLQAGPWQAWLVTPLHR